MQSNQTWGNLDTYIQKTPRLSKAFWLSVGSNQSLGFSSTWQPQTLTDSLKADSSLFGNIQEVHQEIPNSSVCNSSANQFDTQFFNFGHIVLFSAARVLRWVSRVAFSFSHGLAQKLNSRGSSPQEGM